VGLWGKWQLGELHAFSVYTRANPSPEGMQLWGPGALMKCGSHKSATQVGEHATAALALPVATARSQAISAM